MVKDVAKQGASSRAFFKTVEEAKKAGAPNPKFKLFTVTTPDGKEVGVIWQRSYLTALHAAAMHLGYRASASESTRRLPTESAARIAERMHNDPEFRKLVEEAAGRLVATAVVTYANPIVVAGQPPARPTTPYAKSIRELDQQAVKSQGGK